MGLHDLSVYDMISRNAACFGNKDAWFEADTNKTLTFSEFKSLTDQLAAGLQEAGIQKRDRIGVIGKNSLNFFLLYGAAAALGAIVLPINWRLSAEEAAFNLNDCTPVMVFADNEYHGMIKGFNDQIPTVKKYFSLADGKDDFNSFETLTNNPGNFKPADVLWDDGYVIIHTAAVAGRPRGALLSHGNVLCANLHFNYNLKTIARDVHLNLLPMFHVGGLFMAFAAFHAGAENVNMSRFDAEKAVNLINEKNVSLMFDFAPILSAILEECEKTNRTILSLKTVIGLESPETIEKYEKFTGGDFFCMYGQTETSCLTTVGRYDEKPGSAGKSVHFADVRLVNDFDEPVPVGEPGEITVRGPMIFKGYWNLDDDNAKTFAGGWHHTGDLGRFDEDGFLFYAGRKQEKELIKPGGENVYPAEVEKVILEHPAVEKTVVFGVPDPKWKEGIKAVCLLKPGMSLESADLIAFVGERIARYKKPQYVECVTDFPLLPDDQPDRNKIKELYGGEQQ